MRDTSVREIRLFGDPVLRTPTEAVDPADPATARLVEDLLESVSLPGRAGVAANQIGVAARVFSYNIDGDIGYVINPELVEVRGEPVELDEGCLSVPGLYFPRLRHPFARVRGVDLDGRELELAGEGLLAQMLQHETDHLDGKVYVEGLVGDVKREAMRAIRESDWF